MDITIVVPLCKKAISYKIKEGRLFWTIYKIVEGFNSEFSTLILHWWQLPFMDAAPIANYIAYGA